MDSIRALLNITGPKCHKKRGTAGHHSCCTFTKYGRGTMLRSALRTDARMLPHVDNRVGLISQRCIHMNRTFNNNVHVRLRPLVEARAPTTRVCNYGTRAGPGRPFQLVVAASTPVLLQRLKPNILCLQRRTYVFVPSLSEMARSLKQMFQNQKERRTILVKLIKDRTSTAKKRSKDYMKTRFISSKENFQNQKDRRTILVKSIKDQTSTAKERSKNYVQTRIASTKERLLQSKQTRRRERRWVRLRVKTWIDNKTQRASKARQSFLTSMYNRFKLKGSITLSSESARVSTKARSRLHSYRIQGLLKSFKKYQNKYGYNRYRRFREEKSYQRRAITLTEFSQPDWFDQDGYPKTAIDKWTGLFVNPWNSESTNGSHPLTSLLKWRLIRLLNAIKEGSRKAVALSTETPGENDNDTTIGYHVTDTQPSQPISTPLLSDNDDQIKLIWIGHSTCLVHMSGFTVLTDPHFSYRASIVQTIPLGVARDVPPTMSVESLPTIDVCCISHDHYDHLDYESVLSLKNKVRVWVVPLGIKEWLTVECHVDSDQILEVEWWQSVRLKKNHNQGEYDNASLVVVDNDEKNTKDADNSIPLITNSSTTSNSIEIAKPPPSSYMEVTCAPAQHWSCRTPWDRNQRLWCSFALESYREAKLGEGNLPQSPLKFYFGGDTGYPESFPLHRQIGDRLGPFDLCALPIGAYAPSFFMKYSHANPEEALRIHKDVQSKKSVAIHWGTFALAEEDHDEPPQLLREAIDDLASKGDGDNTEFYVIKHGESIESDISNSRDTQVVNISLNEEPEKEDSGHTS